MRSRAGVMGGLWKTGRWQRQVGGRQQANGSKMAVIVASLAP
jgi:hypothetical protein